jgi:hypothetical protein
MASANIVKLLAIKRAQKGLATKITNLAADLMNNDSDIPDLDKVLSNLDRKIKYIEQINEQIIELSDIDEVEGMCVDFDDHITSLYDIKKDIESFISTKNRNEQSQVPSNPSLQASVSNNSNFTQLGNQPNFRASNLPKLSLPRFNGNIIEWCTFWDSFNAAVHQNPTFSPVQKFNYLRSLVEGSAHLTIEGLSLCDFNYDKAISLLHERYGDFHKIINAHMKALLEVERPVSNNDAVSLRRFYDSIESHVRSLDALGQATDTYGDLLTPNILEKIPTEIGRNLTRTHGNCVWKFDDLRKAILTEVNILETFCKDDVSLSTDSTVSSFMTNTNKSNRPRRNGNQSNYKQQSTKKPWNNKYTPTKCVFCQGDHRSIECNKVNSAEERWKIVKASKLCFNCLRSTHMATSCTSIYKCKNCSGNHHTSLCRMKLTNGDVQQNKREEQVTHVNAALTKSSEFTSTNVLLKTAIAKVSSDSEERKANILFDDGSQRTFITNDLVRQLQLKTFRQEKMCITHFGANNSDVTLFNIVKLKLHCDDGGKIEILAYVVPKISTPINNKLSRRQLDTLQHIKGLKLAHPLTSGNTFGIEILIGADFYWNVIQDHIVRGAGPTAIESRIGYLLSGPLTSSSQAMSAVFHVTANHREFNTDLERLWSLEPLGIEQPELSITNSMKLQQYLDTNISSDGNRYTAKLPWKEEHCELPNNYLICQQRLKSTVRKLQKTSMLQIYDDIISEQDRLGFIEKVPDADLNDKCHYIPHHAVEKNSSTTPIRIVYDCSCKSSTSRSLNDCLLAGPPLQNDITEILLRFRFHKFGVVSDIEKAFLQINLHEDDRDYTRFLWLSDPKNANSDIVTYRFKSILFGAKSSPFILNATILKHIIETPSSISEAIKKNIYVDNVVNSFKTESEASDFYKQSRLLLTKGGFNLRSWQSNSTDVMSAAKQDNVQDEDIPTNVLGIKWDVNTDTLRLNPIDMHPPEIPTKRNIVSFMSKTYDPLGFVSPILVKAKMLVQELWKEKMDWDEPVGEDIKVQWDPIAQSIQRVSDISFTRRINMSTTSEQEPVILHVFSDASMKAYGAVAYIQNQDEVSLMMSKARVAPIKTLTVPQLELTAAVIASRLANHIISSLQNEANTIQLHMWSDSQIVLHWIRSNKILPKFVSNRVKQIIELTKPDQWNYCPTDHNPADILSRGCTAEELVNSKLWWKGPTWLSSTVEMQQIKDLHILTTMTSSQPDFSDDNPHTNIESNEQNIQSVFDINRYSSYSRLRRVTAWMFRFINNLRKKDKEHGTLKVHELTNAEHYIIKDCQLSAFPEVIKYLKQGSKGKQPSIIEQLRLYVDDNGIIRSDGRIHNAPLDMDTKFPILLPTRHALTTLIIKATHCNTMHSGVSSTIVFLRQKFWIPRIRQIVKQILHKCVICHKIIGKSYRKPISPPLPSERVNASVPFEVTGIDFAGPLYVKNKQSVNSKVYICLFTCAATRAIHLELINDLSVESFLLCFRRFCSRCSVPKCIMSDNATTFIAASHELQSLLTSANLTHQLAEKGVKWSFIPKRAPWYGGFWERLIGLTKTRLKKVLGRRLVSFIELQTILTEIESILNDRPLTYVSTNVNDIQPISPSSLLYGRRITTLPHHSSDPLVADDVDYNSSGYVQKRYHVISQVLQHFWLRWKHEYLTALRERSLSNGCDTQQHIKVGNVVLIHEDCPRIKWKLGYITSLHHSVDGRIRSVDIKTVYGQTNRPINKLYPLEINIDINTESDTCEPESVIRSIRPKRKAAIIAQNKINKYFANDISESDDD